MQGSGLSSSTSNPEQRLARARMLVCNPRQTRIEMSFKNLTANHERSFCPEELGFSSRNKKKLRTVCQESEWGSV